MKKIKTGLIGLGTVGLKRNSKNKKIINDTHFYNLLNNKNFDLLAVSDLKLNMQGITKNIKNLKYYKNYEKMLSSHFFNMIVIATPLKTHFKIIKYLQKYNIKFIFCEKPFLTNKQELNFLSLDKYKTKYQINYSRRFISNFVKLKKFFNKKVINELVYVNINYSRGFRNNGSHFIDLILWYFGKPNSVKYNKKIKSKSFENDFSVNIILNYKNNFNIYLNSVDIEYVRMEEIDFIFSNKRIRIINDEIQFYKLYEEPLNNMLNKFKLFKVERIDYSNSLKFAYNNIANIFKKKDKIISGLNESKQIMDILNL